MEDQDRPGPKIQLAGQRRPDPVFLPPDRPGAVMKIAIDGYDLTRQSTGVGRYLRNLLPEILKADPGNRYHLFLREDNDLFDRFANLEKTIIPGRWRLFSLAERSAEEKTQQPAVMICCSRPATNCRFFTAANRFWPSTMSPGGPCPGISLSRNGPERI